MIDPDRLEKALPELLKRSGWTGTADNQIPPPLDATEQQRWESLFSEPVAESTPKSDGSWPLAAFSGLAAAGLVAAVGAATFLRTSPATVAPADGAGETLPPPVQQSLPKERLPKPAQLPRTAPVPPFPEVPESGAYQIDRPKPVAARVPASAPSAAASTSRGTAPQTVAPPAVAPAPSSPAERSAALTPGSEKPSPRVMLNAAGWLDPADADALNKQLQTAEIPVGARGEIVFELTLKDGRVIDVVPQEEVSTLTDQVAVQNLDYAIRVWQGVPGVNTTLVISLRIR